MASTQVQELKIKTVKVADIPPARNRTRASEFDGLISELAALKPGEALGIGKQSPATLGNVVRLSRRRGLDAVGRIDAKGEMYFWIDPAEVKRLNAIAAERGNGTGRGKGKAKK